MQLNNQWVVYNQQPIEIKRKIKKKTPIHNVPKYMDAAKAVLRGMYSHTSLPQEKRKSST